MVTSPSVDSRCSASRTRLRLADSSRMMSASTRRCPGTSRPLRMRSRIHSTTALTGTGSSVAAGADLALEETLPRTAAREALDVMAAHNIIK